MANRPQLDDGNPGGFGGAIKTFAKSKKAQVFVILVVVIVGIAYFSQ